LEGGVRAAFDGQLDSLRGRLIVMAATATSAIQWASESLLTVDLGTASQALEAAGQLTDERRVVEVRASELVALQQPVATDLRLVVASLRVGADLERMGGLAAHVAKIMVRRHPAPAVPPPLTAVVRQMGSVAERLAWKVTRALELRDPRLSAELERDDDEMDALQRRQFELVLGSWPYGVAAAVDAALLSRFYERYADHVVNTGEHVTFLITGGLGRRPGSR
jgi:phosphate transport system protein